MTLYPRAGQLRRAGACVAIMATLALPVAAQTPTQSQINAAARLSVEQRIWLVNQIGAEFSCERVQSANCSRRLERAIRRQLGTLSRADRRARPAIRLAAWVAAQDSEQTAGQDTTKPKLTREERALRRLKRQQRQAERAAARADAKAKAVKTEVVTAETARSSAQETARRGNNDSDTLLKILGAAGGLGGGLAIGQLLDNGDEVVSMSDDQVIVRRDGELFLRRDEGALLRRPGARVQTETFQDGSTRTTVVRPNGVRVVTIRDADGNSIRRTRFLPSGREVVLFDDTRPEISARLTDRELTEIQEARRAVLQAPAQASASTEEALRRALRREQRALDRGFSLRQIRENVALREMAPPIDLDDINFRSGSAVITPRQARALAALGTEIAALIDENPDEVFLIEGHTDAVGPETVNLALSDRRAESVALALTEYFDVPPESLVVQGYGENYLKIETQEDSRQNRRATVRRITPLLRSARVN